MTFLEPFLLWGLAGVGAPILIHLFNRFRHRRVEWGAMDLLRRALVTRSRRVRIEDLLLLLLRCAAIALLALSFARATIPPRGGDVAGDGDVAGVLVVDGSYSTMHRPGVRARFDDVRQRAARALGTLAAGSPSSVILAAARPEVLLRATGHDPVRAGEALEASSPRAEPLDLEAALERALELLDELRAPSLECWFATDGQASTWRELSPRARSLLDAVTAKARAFLLVTADTGDANLALSDLAVASGLLRPGAGVRVSARLENHGARTESSVAVELLLDGESVDRRVVEAIEPGAGVEVPLQARLARAGEVPLTARLAADALALDDARHAVASVLESLRVLAVLPEEPNVERSGGDPLLYIESALSAADRASGGFATLLDRIASRDLAATLLEDYEVVLLVGTPPSGRASAEQLAAFVRRGGGLFVFAGEDLAAEEWAALARGEYALLPARPAEKATRNLTTTAPPGATIRPAAGLHPVALALSGLGAERLSRARIERHACLEPVRDARVVLETSGGAPLLLERREGRGGVALFAAPVDGASGSFVREAAFPVLVLRQVERLAAGGDRAALRVGDDVVVPSPAGAAETADVRTPDGAKRRVAPAWKDGVRAVVVEDVSAPGFVEVSTRRDDGPAKRLVAVNIDARESDIAVTSVEALREILAPHGVRVVGPAEDVVTAVREGRTGRELWRGLLVAALALLVLESFLSARVSRRLTVTP